MEKVYVTLLLIAVATLLLCEHGVDARRRAKMSTMWGRQRRTNKGSGSYIVKGTAGGRRREETATPARPTSGDCSEAGFYPTPGSCTAFYRCVDWMGDGSLFSIFHFKCPVGTVFDDDLDVCNHPSWAQRAECMGGSGSVEDPVVITDAPVNVTEPSTEDPVVVTDASTEAPVNVTEPSTEDPVVVTDVSTEAPVNVTTATSETPANTTDAPGDGTSGSATTKSPGVFTLTCYGDNKYRRHPLYCNKYYYCIYDGSVWSVPSFTCPKELVFDEDNQICTRQDMREEVECTLAPYDKPRPGFTEAPIVTEVPSVTETGTPDPGAPGVTEGPVDATTKAAWEVDERSLYDCPAPGYYQFEADCLRFYKCVETDMGKLKGLLYRCPENYGYSGEAERCHKNEDLPECDRNMIFHHIRFETATPLYEEDLMWFFHKSN